MCAVGRTVFSCKCDCLNRLLRFDNPAPLAVMALSTPYNVQMLDSFLEAGGVSAVTQLLRESKCPATTGCTAAFIDELMEFDRSGKKDQRRGLEKEFFQSGAVRWLRQPGQCRLSRGLYTAGLGWVNKGTLKNTLIKVRMKSLIRAPRN
jgi:hypothetical protein